MIKHLVYISIIIITSCSTTKRDQFELKLDLLGQEVINSEQVVETIFNQELTGIKYTIEYKDSIQIACYDVSRTEYTDCNTTIDITNFDIRTNLNFKKLSVDELYTDYLEQQKKQNIPADEIEFIVENVPEGFKKVNAGLLSIDQHEIILLTSEQLIIIMLNEESLCKIPGILNQFYTKELPNVLGIDRAELKWTKI